MTPRVGVGRGLDRTATCGSHPRMSGNGTWPVSAQRPAKVSTPTGLSFPAAGFRTNGTHRLTRTVAGPRPDGPGGKNYLGVGARRRAPAQHGPQHRRRVQPASPTRDGGPGGQDQPGRGKGACFDRLSMNGTIGCYTLLVDRPRGRFNGRNYSWPEKPWRFDLPAPRPPKATQERE